MLRCHRTLFRAPEQAQPLSMSLAGCLCVLRSYSTPGIRQQIRPTTVAQSYSDAVAPASWDFAFLQLQHHAHAGNTAHVE